VLHFADNWTNIKNLEKNNFETYFTLSKKDLIEITNIKYEKKIDSLLVGFNFGCFQIWNMKTLKIESSSDFGEYNNKPIVGFSLMQPENDPKKCVYLMVAHSTQRNPHVKNVKKRLEKLMSQLNASLQQQQQQMDSTNDSLMTENEESMINRLA
jgi:ferric iron reductase protein FhuF